MTERTPLEPGTHNSKLDPGQFETRNCHYLFDPMDVEQIRLLSRPRPGRRIQVMLDARELAVGLICGRLRRQYSDLSLRELNLRVLEGVERVQRTTP